MNITIFLSANDLEAKYTEPAQKFAQLMANAGHDLVWGGSEKGLMKIVADTVRENGGKLIGVGVELLKHTARQDCDELTMAPDISTRRRILLEKGEVVVMMVGGIGTLDEVTDVLELKKHGLHNKPIVILNTDNFYEGLKVQLQKMKDDGFINRPLDELVYFADTPDEAMEYIEEKLN